MQNTTQHVSDMLTDTVIVGYNINNFDIPILKRHLDKFNKPLLHKFSIDLYPACWRNKKQKLKDAIQSYNLQPNPNPHDALADANSCIDLLSQLIHKNELPKDEQGLLNLFNSPDNIWHHYNKIPVIDINNSHPYPSYNTPPSTQP
jgi:DNA polymerase III epsilon subunit-like protein